MSHHPAFVSCLAQKAVALQRQHELSIRDAVRRATDNLQPPWADSDEALAHEVYEKITLDQEKPF